MEQLFDDYTFRTVTLGTAILGAVSGALGTFAVLRRQSLLGDAVSHAALPGIGLAFILTGSKASLVLIVGAGLAGWFATAIVLLVTTSTRVKYDSALGLVLSVFFGAGLVLLTFIQKYPNANQAGLDSFLFGQAASLVVGDVITMTVLGGVALMALLLFWKEFKLLAFDPEFAHSLVLPVRWLDIGLTTLLVVAIVIGLQTGGSDSDECHDHCTCCSSASVDGSFRSHDIDLNGCRGSLWGRWGIPEHEHLESTDRPNHCGLCQWVRRCVHADCTTSRNHLAAGSPSSTES